MTQTLADSGTVSRAVVVRLRGGIGNQMFEYAVGRCVAEKHGRELFLDDLALQEDPPGVTKRLYSLDVFQIQAHLTSQKRIAIGEEIYPYKYFGVISAIRRCSCWRLSGPV